MTTRKRLIQDLLWMCALAGALAAGFRLWFGLGATTALSDNFPWGLWKILNMVAGVALSTGGFTLGFLVYALGRKRYSPLLKSAILIAFLGYGSSCLALLFDIGLPQRFWHPMVFWNETSFLFEVFWCVLLYFTVTAVEMAPILLERLGIRRPLPLLHKIAFVVVFIGISLSCLHHSSLGSLFLVTPLRLHSLWYSPILPLAFILSAMGAGLMVVILARLFSWWLLEPETPQDAAPGDEIERLAGLARIAVWILGSYLLLKLGDLFIRGGHQTLLLGQFETGLFLTETLLLAVLPILLVVIPRTRHSRAGLAAASVSTVMGLVLNRLNVGIFGYFRDAKAVYVPSAIEWTLSIGVIAVAVLVFLYAVEYLPVFERSAPTERLAGVPSGERFVGTLRIPSIVLRYGLYRVTLFAVLWLPLMWVLLYPPFAARQKTVVQPSRGLDPQRSLLQIDGNRSGLSVAFPHTDHQKRLGGEGSCVHCHHIALPNDHSTPCSRCHRRMIGESRLFDHSKHLRFVAAENRLVGLHPANRSCGLCHPPGTPRQGATAKPCLDCHREDMGAQEFDSNALERPCGFAEAMHGTCLECHRTHTEKPQLSRCDHCHSLAGQGGLKHGSGVGDIVYETRIAPATGVVGMEIR